MYLSTPEEGGETVFPDAEFKSTGERGGGIGLCVREWGGGDLGLI